MRLEQETPSSICKTDNPSRTVTLLLYKLRVFWLISWRVVVVFSQSLGRKTLKWMGFDKTRSKNSVSFT